MHLNDPSQLAVRQTPAKHFLRDVTYFFQSLPSSEERIRDILSTVVVNRIMNIIIIE